MLKDHLGNVRMVLTEEQKTDIYPAATLETAKIATEQNYYTINTAQVVEKSAATGIPAYQNNNTIPNPPVNAPFDNANSAKLYVLNKNTQKTGLGITLKVMSGDKLDVYGKSYYFQNNTGGTAANGAIPILDILTGFLGSPSGGVAGAHGAVTATQLNGLPGTTGLISSLLTNQTNTNNSTPVKPKAFINYILFDEQFKSVGSGFASVGENAVLTDYASTPSLHNIAVNKNGFVYIWCSNESPVDVFFDNIQVVQTKGPILEETHYYPFGLTMAGISSKAAGGVDNKNKYNGIEFDQDLSLDIYEAFFRNLDPQIGRWWQVDPKTENMEMWSPYVSNFDNPILYQDPLGDEGEACCWGFLDALVDAGDKIMASASGVLWGGLNTMSNGIISSDPFDLRSRLSSENQMYFDNAINVGKVAPLFATRGRTGRATEVAPELAPVGVAPKVKVKIESANPGVATPNQVQAKANKGPKDLGGGGKNAQHANQKARGAAEKRYNDAKVNRDKLNSKPNKTKEDKQELDKLNKQVKHEKQKMDNVGENHSRKAKGSN